MTPAPFVVLLHDGCKGRRLFDYFPFNKFVFIPNTESRRYSRIVGKYFASRIKTLKKSQNQNVIGKVDELSKKSSFGAANVRYFPFYLMTYFISLSLLGKDKTQKWGFWSALSAFKCVNCLMSKAVACSREESYLPIEIIWSLYRSKACQSTTVRTSFVVQSINEHPVQLH